MFHWEIHSSVSLAIVHWVLSANGPFKQFVFLTVASLLEVSTVVLVGVTVVNVGITPSLNTLS